MVRARSRRLRCGYSNSGEVRRAAWTTLCPARAAERTFWESLVWSAKEVNQRRPDRFPREAGLKLLSIPRAPKESPLSALIHNAHGIEE